MSQLLPLFVDLAGRRVLLVGAGRVAAAKLGQLLAARADVRVVALDVCEEVERAGVPVERRAFEAADLDGVWLVVAAATPEGNREVAAVAGGGGGPRSDRAAPRRARRRPPARSGRLARRGASAAGGVAPRRRADARASAF